MYLYLECNRIDIIVYCFSHLLAKFDHIDFPVSSLLSVTFLLCIFLFLYYPRLLFFMCICMFNLIYWFSCIFILFLWFPWCMLVEFDHIDYLASSCRCSPFCCVFFVYSFNFCVLCVKFNHIDCHVSSVLFILFLTYMYSIWPHWFPCLFLLFLTFVVYFFCLFSQFLCVCMLHLTTLIYLFFLVLSHFCVVSFQVSALFFFSITLCLLLIITITIFKQRITNIKNISKI